MRGVVAVALASVMSSAAVLAGCASTSERCAPASEPHGSSGTASEPHGSSGAASAPGELPTFAAYAVDSMLRGEPAPVDLASHPDGPRLAEHVMAGADGPPDFAGGFRIVSWSCGTQCTTGVVIDFRDGSLHTLPTAELGLEYRLESALLIVNPHPEALFAVGETPDWARTRYFHWDGERFHLLGPLFMRAP
jgi:hypothetical protein